MKIKILFPIAIFFVSINLLTAQVEFPTLNAHWCYNQYTELSFDPFSFCIQPSELVEFNGKTYSKIRTFTTPYDDMQDVLYRGEGRKFYVIPQDSTEEILIYDFDLEVGDTFVATWGWQIWDSISLEVGAVDTIVTFDGVARKRISLSNVSNYGVWIEGIGSDSWSFVYPGYSGWLDSGFEFVCHFQEEEQIYPIEPWINCDLDEINSISEIEVNTSFDFYPNPAQDQLTIQFPDTKSRPWKLLNINGKVIQAGEFATTTETVQLNQLPLGVYFLRVADFQMQKVVIGF